MPTTRTTFILAVLVLLGLGYLVFFESRTESTDQQAVTKRHILHVRASQVVAVAFHRDNWTNPAIERIDGSTWKRTLPVAGAADSPLILELLSDLEFLEHKVELEGHANDVQRLYDEGLSPPQLTVTLTLADRRELEFEFGKETPTADGTYFHVRDETRVQVVDKKLKERFDALIDSLNDTSGAGAAEGTVKPDAAKGESHGSD
jgi:hypothetical protein